jgi:hypothetical protein
VTSHLTRHTHALSRPSSFTPSPRIATLSTPHTSAFPAVARVPYRMWASSASTANKDNDAKKPKDAKDNRTATENAALTSMDQVSVVVVGVPYLRTVSTSPPLMCLSSCRVCVCVLCFGSWCDILVRACVYVCCDPLWRVYVLCRRIEVGLCACVREIWMVWVWRVWALATCVACVWLCMCGCVAGCGSYQCSTAFCD